MVRFGIIEIIFLLTNLSYRTTSAAFNNSTERNVINFGSPGQEALAIICRSDDSKTIEMLKKIEDKNSRIEVEAERSLSEHIDSGCRFPVGAYASVKSDSLILKVGVYSMDGKKSILIEENGTIDNPFELGKKIGNELKSQGVSEIASNWREKLEEWNKQ